MTGEPEKEGPAPPPATERAGNASSKAASRSAARKAPGRRRWPRRLAFAAIGLAIVLVLLRFGLVLSLPSILSSAARRYDLSCAYERLDLSALAGDVELWRLAVRPIEGGDPIADMEYCRADLSMPHLLIGKIVFRRLEIDGLDLLIERDADGKLALSKRMERARAARGPEPPPSPPGPDGKEPDEIDLTLPVRIDALRAQHVRTRIVDRSVTPTFDARVDCHFRISDLGSTERPARIEASISSPTLVDRLEVEGRAASAGKKLEAHLDVAGSGIHPAALASLLAPLGIRPAEGDVAFGLRARVTADPAPAVPNAVAVKASIENAAAFAEDEEAMALDKLVLEADAVGPGVLHVATLAFEGARLQARRLPDGAVRFAGFDFLPARPAAPRTEPVPATPSAPAPALPAGPPRSAAPQAAPAPPPALKARDPAAPPPPPPLIIREIALRGARVSFTDEAVAPRVEIAVEAEALVKDIVNDASRPPVPGRVEVKLTAPGLIRAATLRGEALPFAKRKTASFTGEAAGIRPDALAPYLEAATLESRLADGNVTFALEGALEIGDGGRIGIEAAIRDVRYRDADDLFTLAKVSATGIEIDPREKAIRAEDITIAGPRAAAHRDAEGNIDALGFRLRGRDGAPKRPRPAGRPQAPANPPDASDAAPALAAHHLDGGPRAAAAPADKKGATGAERPPAPAPAPGGPRAGYRIEIGRFAIEEVQARIADEAVSPPASITVTDAGVEIRDIRIDLEPGAPAPESGKLRAWLAAPGLAEEVTGAGSLRLQPEAPLLDAEVAARRVTVSALAPYLKAARLEPAIKDGALKFHVRAEAAAEGESRRASLAVDSVAFTDGEEELAGVDSFLIRDARLDRDGLSVGAIAIEKPRARGRRSESGEVKLMGFRVLPPPAAGDAKELAAEPAPSPGKRAAEKPGTESTEAAPRASVTEVKSFLVKGAVLRWDDAALSPSISGSSLADLEISGLVIGKEAAPARVRASLRVPESLEALDVNGTLSLGPASRGITLDASGHGLRAGPLAAYFPPGTGLSLEDGRFRARLEAGVAPAAEGGHQASCTVSGVEYRDGPAGPLLFGFDSLRFIASRIDPEGGLIHIDEVSLAGLEGNVERRQDGSVHVLGFLSRPVEGREAEETRRGADPEVEPEREAPPVATAPAPAKPSADQPAVGDATPQAPRAHPPILAIDKVDLEIKRFAITDHARPGSAPVEIAEFRLRNPKRIELLGEEAEARAPAELELTGRLNPLVKSFGAKASLEPFAAHPAVKVAIAADGVRGEGLTEIVPELREKLDGKPLTDGKLRAEMELTLRARRRHPLDFDLASGFGLEFQLKEAAFRNADGPVLIGLDDLSVDVAKVDPRTGGIHVRTIEVTNPQGFVSRKEDGVEALGLLVKLPAKAAPAPEGAAPAAEPPPASPSAPGSSSTPPGSPAAAGPEIKVDSLVLSGIDFTYEDVSVKPAMSVPLKGLELEMARLTTRALTEPRPVRFSVLVRSGKVPLPERLETGAFATIAGGISDAVTVMARSDVGIGATEERLFFDEVALNGDLALYPAPAGWMKASVSGLDLANLKGPASGAGVTLDGGLFDVATNLRFAGDGSVNTKTRLAFDSLSVSERPQGPISRYLKLPAPLDAVLFALRDEENTIHVPLDVHVGKEGLGSGALAGATVTALGAVIGKAIASAPLRLATAFIPAAEEKQGGEQPIVLEFEPGGIDLPRGGAYSLAPVAGRLEDDDEVVVTLRHELGAADIERMKVRANPAAEEARQIADRLRARRADLLRGRAEAAERARAAFAAGLHEEERIASAAVRSLDAELGNTERALDHIAELLRPGAENRAPRRTRGACIDLGRERLQGVRKALVEALAEEVPGVEARLRVERARAGEATATARGRVLVIAGRKKL